MNCNKATVDRNGRRGTKKARQRHSLQPAVGALEDRVLLSTFTVNNPTDAPVAGETDLRQAVALANSTTGASTIEFDSTVFSAPQTITLILSPLSLTNAGGTTINGPAAGVTVSGGSETGVFDVSSGATATIAGLTIAHGYANDGGGIVNSGSLMVDNSTILSNGATTLGGGIDNNNGTLTVTNSTVEDNSCGEFGGGIYNSGTVTVVNSTLEGNLSEYGAGIDSSLTVTVVDSTLAGNMAQDDGGGINNGGTVSLTNSIIATNTAPTGPDIAGSFGSHGNNLIGESNGSSGVWLASDLTGTIALPLNPLLTPLGDYGGPTLTMALLPGSPAIQAGIEAYYPNTPITTDQRGFALDSPTPDIGAFQTQSGLAVDATIDGTGSAAGQLSLRQAVNLANALGNAEIITFDPTVFASALTIDLSGGPLELTNTGGTLSITGPAAGVTLVDFGSAGIFTVESGVTATIAGLTIYGGSANDGGGIANFGTLTVTNTMITKDSAENSTSLGGGIYNKGTLTVASCSLLNDEAASGGGLYNSGTATVVNSSISDNIAVSGNGLYNTGTLTIINSLLSGNVFIQAYGGAIYNTGMVTVTNSTLSGNTAQAGGGIDNYGTVTLTSSTLAGNSASFYGGGVNNGGTLNLANTMIATNTAPAGPDVDGAVTSSGYNLIGETNASSGWLSSDRTGTITQPLNPLLAPLGEYGGPTQTMALLPGSPAIDAGSNALVPAGVTTDERGTGFARVVNGVVDIGAFESSGFTVAVAAGNSQSTTVSTAFPTALHVTVTPKNAGDPVNGGIVTFAPPFGGASATLSPSAATIVLGTASVRATANSIAGGPYAVSVACTGASPVSIALSNTPGPASASFLGTDMSTQGNWLGVYGAQGYTLVSGPTGNPSYATPTVSGESTYTWTTTGTAAAALETPNSTNRIAAAWYSSTSFTIDVNLTDGQSHDIALYALDYDNKGRAEQIQISSTTGTMLNTENISSFTGGVYLKWAITGSVVITVTSTGKANAVVNGLFFDAGSTTATASFVKSDTTTEGNWIGTYGSQGYNIVSGPSSDPSYATVTQEAQSSYAWSTTLTTEQALEIPGSSNRVAAVWYSSNVFTIDVNFTDGNAHDIALYALDYDNKGRSEKIQIENASTKAVLDTENVSNFTNGVYLQWNVSGNVVITVTCTGGPNAVVDGVFIDPGTSPADLTLPSDSTAGQANPIEVSSTDQTAAALRVNSVPLVGSGMAAPATSARGLGTQSVTAVGSGGANLKGVQSGESVQQFIQAGTEVVLVPQPVFNKKKVVMVGLKASIEPRALGGGVPTGEVIFEIVKTTKKKTKTTTLGTVAMSGGDATLMLKASKVKNGTIKVVYSGDHDFQSSTATRPALQKPAQTSLARPTIAMVYRGRLRLNAANTTAGGRGF
jgi:hypothetical protein